MLFLVVSDTSASFFKATGFSTSGAGLVTGAVGGGVLFLVAGLGAGLGTTDTGGELLLNESSETSLLGALGSSSISKDPVT